MKTEAELKAEIAEQRKAVEKAREALRNAAAHKDNAPGVWKASAIEKKKAEGRLKFLQELMPYVRSNPRAEFLQQQIKKLGGKIQLLEQGYRSLYPESNDPKHRQRYEKEHNMPAMKKQLNTLKYLTT